MAYAAIFLKCSRSRTHPNTYLLHKVTKHSAVFWLTGLSRPLHGTHVGQWKWEWRGFFNFLWIHHKTITQAEAPRHFLSGNIPENWAVHDQSGWRCSQSYTSPDCTGFAPEAGESPLTPFQQITFAGDPYHRVQCGDWLVDPGQKFKKESFSWL